MRIRLNKFKNRLGFTLVELLISVFIFSMMMTALVAIYGTINKHMFQSYRQNIVKNNLAIAVKTIQVKLMAATRVDIPAYTAFGNTLAFVTNVDKQTGCSPVNPDPAIANAWHYFCLSGTNLYYHTGNVTSDTGGCPCDTSNTNTWIGTIRIDGRGYPIGFCGIGGGGTVTQLLGNAQIPAMGALFSRRIIEGIREVDQVRVSLRATSNIAVDDYKKGARPIDVTLDAVVHIQSTP
ncbi:MAG: prepilin-type N-terminal cleavage/methylation domain-containing protein [Elusimicrobia bacterium]|nr:prepilin-type N-terminal cleavage/methylation domain-containing protein [Elusimicrobiota bacterium]